MFETKSAFEFFKSAAARAPNSQARVLIENGRSWIQEMLEVELARLLFAALALGGTTLSKYLKWNNGFTEKKTEEVCKKLRELLGAKYYGLGLEPLYARWLSKSYHRLNETSVIILE